MVLGARSGLLRFGLHRVGLGLRGRMTVHPRLPTEERFAECARPGEEGRDILGEMAADPGGQKPGIEDDLRCPIDARRFVQDPRRGFARERDPRRRERVVIEANSDA